MHSSGIVINSYNSGNITGETNVSGIVSSDQFGSIILNSYNTGNVTGTSIVSGIANITRQIDNVYNSGKVTGSSDVAQIYNIIEDGYEGLVKNAYYLDNNSEELEKEGTNSKTEIEMKSVEFAQLLNSNRIEIDLSEVESVFNYYLKTEKNTLEWQYKLGEYPTFNLLKRININMDNEEITQLQNNSEVTEITVENEIKKYNITTEIGINSAGERAGGTVTGDYNEKFVESAKIKFVESVKHGNANGETIEIIPNTDYDIVKITINGEEVTFDLDENGKAIIKPGYFENVTEDKHIVVIFEKGLSKVIEHHYLKNSEGNYTTIPVADDVYYTGKKGEEYTTSPKTNLKDVTLEKNENKEYVIPSNARGEYKEEIQEVTYYYEPKGINLIVRHYFEGTENNIILNGQKVEDTTEMFMPTVTINGGKYEIKQYGSIDIDQNSNYKNIIEDYELVSITSNIENKKNVIVEDLLEFNKDTEVIYYYKLKEHVITTDVIEHKEVYKEEFEDGTVKENVKENVKGGKISGEDLMPYEKVSRGNMPQKEIKITPIKTSEENYEIIKVTVKEHGEDDTGITVNLEEIEKAEDGSIILPTKYLADPEKGMQSDKHVEVEFRKKTNVIIKHLEKGTGQVLYQTPEGKDYEEITGYEGKEFETARKTIQNYMASEVGITDENNNVIEKYSKITTDKDTYANGTMYADTLTIIYWYERIPAGIIVKHIEINEQDKKEGLTLQSGTVLDEEILNGFVSLTEDTERKIYSEESGEVKNEKYKNYISVDGPQSTDENLIIVGKNQNTKDVIYKQESTIEVRYYYEKQHKLTTEVKPHTETIDGAEKLVDGGTISKEYITDSEGNKQETTYETINHRGYNKKQIEITPNSGYRAKQITIQNVSKTGEVIAENIYARTDFEEDSNHKITLKSGEINEDDAYFKDVQKDIHVIVEFERIPAKVIIEYRDVDTGEIIPGTETKPIEKFVGDKYETEPKDIENYVFVEEKYPSNSKGTMTQEDITVVYWYTKQYKITTDVIEHTEVDKNGNVSKQKGGSITAEDENPYELVNRGNSNTLDIEIEPFSGYKIKEIQINGKVVDYINDENIVKEGNKAKILGGYFNKMQEDKHITVEYERIPAVVKVQYLEEETEKILYTTKEGIEYEQIDGYVNDKYETKEKDIEYYEFVKEKYPENSEGLMTEDEITVKYYYKKLPFNMKVEKEIESIILNGQNVEFTDKNKAKVEIKYKNINEIKLEISYKIKVTNTEDIEGTVVLEEVLPEGFDFVKENSDINWKEKDGKYILETQNIKPKETKEYRVTLSWKQEETNKAEKINTVKITKTENLPEYEETTKEDNEAKAVIKIKLDKTIEDIKDGKLEETITNIKTGDKIVISFIGLAVSVAIIVILEIKRKNVNKN